MKFILFVFLVLSSGCLDEAVQSRSVDIDAAQGTDAGVTDAAADLDVQDVAKDQSPDLPPTCSEACDNNFVCDPATKSCVGCLTTANCGDGQVCDQTAKLCVGCLVTTDCAAGVCDQTAKLCVGCLITTDCAAGVCDTTANDCVACLVSGDCADGLACDEEVNACVGCVSDSDCTGELVCDIQANLCVGCVDNFDCSNGFVCDSADNACVRCFDASQCGTNEACNAGRTCECAADKVQCSGSTDCVDISTCDDPLDYADTNGDMADGVVGHTIFLSKMGSNDNDGTAPNQAVATLSVAMSKAIGSRNTILITDGEFAATSWIIPATTNIQAIVGGYDVSFVGKSNLPTRITNSSSNPTLTVDSTSPVTLKALVLGAPKNLWGSGRFFQR